MTQRILIVDDIWAIRFALSEYFIAAGFDTDCAHDVASARSLLTSRDYDAVIADLKLGTGEELGGLDVIDDAVRQRHRPCVVLLSANHSEPVVQDALRRGADITLHKPLPLLELKAHIGEYLSHRAVQNTGPER